MAAPFGRPGEIEDDELGAVGLVDDDFVKSDRGVHATDVGRLSKRRCHVIVAAIKTRLKEQNHLRRYKIAKRR